MGWGIAGAITVLLTLFGERVYAIGGRPDLGVALLFVARAVGTGIGPLLARRFIVNESPANMRWLLGTVFSLAGRVVSGLLVDASSIRRRGLRRAGPLRWERRCGSTAR